MNAPSWLDRRREDDDLTPRDPGASLPWQRFVGLVGLVYLADPLLAGWRLRDTADGLVGLAAVVAFAAVWVWQFAQVRPLRPAWVEGASPAGTPWPVLVRYGVLCVLVVVATVSLGQVATATWVFLAVIGLLTFRGWLPYAVAAGLVVLYEVLAYRLDAWERDNSQSVAIALAVLAVTGTMLAMRRQRDLAEARRENARLAVEEERNRVARDLHDILGHSLTVIRVKAELATRLVDLDPGKAKAEMAAVESLSREALADVRGAVEGFREISLAGEIARARAALESAGIEADLPRRVDGIDPALRELYAWTVREGVTNVIRHSGARVCRVHIDDDGLRLSDDGQVTMPGPAGRRQGHGLGGLAERARAVGATLSARRVDPRGFELVVSANGSTGGDA
ncbi:sensor histidine kinase [Phycicoccus flavus]|uniref:sensor histidine kinase n=1 Tax=Phycicoccus flavus TaxID=2502783 RepID=UPI000FEC0073|nr:histidine kinase [Phycicoccus flavus]NHA67319.1 histidine kinase [Phycicoccus flavus]